MVAMDSQPGLTPSIIDRLTDAESRGTVPKPGYSVEQMARAIQRDLEFLLNSRSDDDAQLHQYRLYTKVAGYGLPDLGVLTRLQELSQEGICRILEEKILRYEPRLKDVQVSLREIEAGNPLKVQLHLRAVLSVDPAPELAIDTVLDLGSGEFKHVTAS
jgi:type VI secretion system protein ImpF